MKLKTIIVEDEIIWQRMLTGILQTHCKDSVELVDVTASVEQSIQSIIKNKPQLVFLDIKLGDNEDGAFHILKSLDRIDFKIVFTTVYDTPSKILLAINEFSAIKYLVKPLKSKQVIESVNCVLTEMKLNAPEIDMVSLKKLLGEFTKKEAPCRLQIPQKDGFRYLPFESVIMMRADGNSTLVFTAENDTLISIKNLGYFESVLPAEKFLRVSRSFIINLGQVERYSTEDGGTIYLHCDCTAPLSETKKSQFFKLLKA